MPDFATEFVQHYRQATAEDQQEFRDALFADAVDDLKSRIVRWVNPAKDKIRPTAVLDSVIRRLLVKFNNNPNALAEMDNFFGYLHRTAETVLLDQYQFEQKAKGYKFNRKAEEGGQFEQVAKITSLVINDPNGAQDNDVPDSFNPDFAEFYKDLQNLLAEKAKEKEYEIFADYPRYYKPETEGDRRRRQILTYVVAGYTSREIAKKLNLNEHQVENDRRVIRAYVLVCQISKKIDDGWTAKRIIEEYPLSKLTHINQEVMRALRLTPDKFKQILLNLASKDPKFANLTNDPDFNNRIAELAELY